MRKENTNSPSGQLSMDPEGGRQPGSLSTQATGNVFIHIAIFELDTSTIKA